MPTALVTNPCHLPRPRPFPSTLLWGCDYGVGEASSETSLRPVRANELLLLAYGQGGGHSGGRASTPAHTTGVHKFREDLLGSSPQPLWHILLNPLSGERLSSFESLEGIHSQLMSQVI